MSFFFFLLTLSPYGLLLLDKKAILVKSNNIVLGYYLDYKCLLEESFHVTAEILWVDVAPQLFLVLLNNPLFVFRPFQLLYIIVETKKKEENNYISLLYIKKTHRNVHIMVCAEENSLDRKESDPNTYLFQRLGSVTKEQIGPDCYVNHS